MRSTSSTMGIVAELVIKTISHLTNNIRIGGTRNTQVMNPLMIENDEITVEGDIKPIAPGHIVSIESELLLEASRYNLAMTAEVVSQETMPNQARRLILKLRDYDKNLWQKYLTALAQQQAHVQGILGKYKGSDE